MPASTCDHLGGQQLLAREEVEAGVEDGEGHQLVLAHLVGRELGARGPGQHLGDSLVAVLLLQVVEQYITTVFGTLAMTASAPIRSPPTVV